MLGKLGKTALIGTAAISLGGCTSLKEYVHNGFKVGPNYVTPPAPVAKSWIEANDARLRTDSDDLSKWWTVFNDPTLDALVCDAYRQNLTLKEAGMRVVQARAQLGIAVGELFPQQQGAEGSFSQNAISGAQANRQFTPERFFGNWNVGVGLSWELDFWGRFRRAVESADANLNASVFQYDDVLVTLLGDVASNYVQLRTYEQQLAYTKRNAALQREVLGIAAAQFRGGQVSELDPDQAQSNLSQVESQIPQLEISIRQTANRLCILLGIPAEDLQARIGPGAIPTAPPDAFVGTPADLLRRRPDVRAQERLAAAQAAQIGIAEAQFYPAISINGTIGVTAQNFNDLFGPQALSGAVGPSFQWNLLNYGRLLNNVRLQEAKFQEQVFKYQNTVIKANAEVEDGLIAFLKSHQTAKSLAESVAAAEKSVKVAVAQYKGGTIDFNRVALLEQNLVAQQNLLAQARGSIALGLILTYKALGGGWEIRTQPCDCPGLFNPPAANEQVLPGRVVSMMQVKPADSTEVIALPAKLPDPRPSGNGEPLDSIWRTSKQFP